MTTNEIAEIWACLPKGKTPFYYFKGMYALELLGYCVGEAGARVSDIRRTRCSRLLARPGVRPALAAAGDGVLRKQHLYSAWQTDGQVYLLTLGTWGRNRHRRSCQMSRAGSNLVLQLNFSNQFLSRYRKVFHGYESQWWNRRGHPTASAQHETIAWARLDIDIARGEALIEEVQSDWIRGIVRFKTSILEYVEGRMPQGYERNYREWYLRNRRSFTCWQDVVDIVQRELAPYAASWDEAMLWAAIWFLREELGIRRIFYNTRETGSWMKGAAKLGPVSLYSSLPERFCFIETCECPAFLAERWARKLRTRGRYSTWYGLEL